MSELGALKGDLNKVAKFAKNILAAQEAVEILLTKEGSIKDLERTHGKLTKEVEAVEARKSELITANKEAEDYALGVVAKAKAEAQKIVGDAKAKAGAIVDEESGDIADLKKQKATLKKEIKSLGKEINVLSTEKTKLSDDIGKLKKKLGGALAQF